MSGDEKHEVSRRGKNKALFSGKKLKATRGQVENN